MQRKQSCMRKPETDKLSTISADKRIYVTQPYLPPLEEFIPYLEAIWNKKILTNGGPFHQKLENDLCEYLGVKYISLFTNGTLALVTALQALGIKGDVITTPYSFVATAHSILWNGLCPVFVDIDPKTLNIDPNKIEAAITQNTRAIMPVHCYGYPCDVERIQEIADKHRLKVIYDAAHAFGVQYKGRSVLEYGDLSILSFHATKVFNTFEGGAIICGDAKTKEHIDHLKNFGFVDETTVVEPGINGKMSEINAAFGLVQLQYIDAALDRRKQIDLLYRMKLDKVDGIVIPNKSVGTKLNYSYFPILIQPNYPLTRDQLYKKLADHNVFTRRYFYPLIPNFPMYCSIPSAQLSNLPIAFQVADQVLCLPIYPDLTDLDLARISELVAGAAR